MSLDNRVRIYNDLANETWRRMVDLVGVHTVSILVQRTIWMTGQIYSEASLIELDDAGISFEKLAEADPDQVKALVEEFFGSLISILTQLVGSDIARKLAEELDTLAAGKEGI